MSLSYAEFLQAVQTLGLRPDGKFTEAEVKVKHRALTQNWHPDQYNADADLSNTAGAHMKSLNIARDDLLAWLADGKPAWRPEAKQSSSAESGASNPWAGQSAPPEPPPAAAVKSASERCFERELGKWPAIFRLSSGQGYELYGRHSAPTTGLAAQTGAYVAGWIVFAVLLLLCNNLTLAIILGPLSIFVSRPTLTQLFKVNLRVVFTQGHIHWSMPGLLRFHVRPDDRPYFRRDIHLSAAEEARLEQEQTRLGRKPAPRLYQDTSQVFVDIGPGRRISLPMAAIVKDPHQEWARLLLGAVQFVYEAELVETMERAAKGAPATPPPAPRAWSWNDRIQAMLLWRKGVASLAAPCLVALIMAIHYGEIKLSGPEATFFPSDVPLANQRVTPLHWIALSGRCYSRRNAVGSDITPECARIVNFVQSGSYQIIECNYGPVRNSGSGYRAYSVWAGRVPADIPSYAVPGDQHPFTTLGKRAINECPRTMAAMDNIFQAGRLTQADWTGR